jgi:hypothetical protein
MVANSFRRKTKKWESEPCKTAGWIWQNKVWSLSMIYQKKLSITLDHAFPDNNEANNIGQQLKEPLKRSHFRWLFGNLF